MDGHEPESDGPETQRFLFLVTDGLLRPYDFAQNSAKSYIWVTREHDLNE